MAAQTSELIYLSESSGYGEPIAIGTSATAVHMANAAGSPEEMDQVFLWIGNTHSTTAQTVTVDVGSTTWGRYSIPPNAGFVGLIPGTMIGNSKTIELTAGSSGTVVATGHVIRHTKE